jgi:hypothetical protein
MQQVGVHRVGRLLARGGEIDGNVALAAVGHQASRGSQVPFAPGRDHADAGLQGVGAELEAHLVIALARGAVGNGIGAGLVGDFHQALGDQRPGDGRAEQVFPLVHALARNMG